MRKLDQAKVIHKDHISGILDLDYAPTGREFVTGAFDKTLRIFKCTEGRSREVYHTRRMQQYEWQLPVGYTRSYTPWMIVT